MKTYGQYCPIAKAAEVLGERWTLLIVRDMICGATRFNELARGLPKLSRPLLSKRLKQLEAAGLVERAGDEYHLTPPARDLERLIFGLGEWSARWTFDRPMPEELDTDVLMWWMQTRVDLARTPDRRVVVQFRYPDVRKWYWLVLDPGEASVCLTDPGFDVDVAVETDAATMYEAWLGRVDLDAAIADGRITVRGPRGLARAFSTWLKLSPMAYASIGLRAR